MRYTIADGPALCSSHEESRPTAKSFVEFRRLNTSIKRNDIPLRKQSCVITHDIIFYVTWQGDPHQ